MLYTTAMHTVSFREYLLFTYLFPNLQSEYSLMNNIMIILVSIVFELVEL